MEYNAYDDIKRKYNYFSDDEAREAIDFTLDLLYAAKRHLQESEPDAHVSISRLEAAYRELSDLASNIEKFME
jgi:hypothetical protein